MQHLYCFLQFCGSTLPKGQRQLDCAGVATTVLAIAHTLALQPEHADLGSCRFQVHLALHCQSAWAGSVPQQCVK